MFPSGSGESDGPSPSKGIEKASCSMSGYRMHCDRHYIGRYYTTVLPFCVDFESFCSRMFVQIFHRIQKSNGSFCQGNVVRFPYARTLSFNVFCMILLVIVDCRVQ